ncbi:hypothetical protein AAHZ94_28030, partial [Streptomyces sp. HSW2009]
PQGGARTGTVTATTTPAPGPPAARAAGDLPGGGARYAPGGGGGAGRSPYGGLELDAYEDADLSAFEATGPGPYPEVDWRTAAASGTGGHLGVGDSDGDGDLAWRDSGAGEPNGAGPVQPRHTDPVRLRDTAPAQPSAPGSPTGAVPAPAATSATSATTPTATPGVVAPRTTDGRQRAAHAPDDATGAPLAPYAPHTPGPTATPHPPYAPHPTATHTAADADGGAGAGAVAGDGGPGRPADGPVRAGRPAEVTVARPAVEHAVRTLADDAAHGLPRPWAKAVREAAQGAADGLAQALDAVVDEVADGAVHTAPGQPGALAVRPHWWAAARLAQRTLLAVQLLGLGWLVAVVAGVAGGAWWAPAALFTCGVAAGPAVTRLCTRAAREPARDHGEEAELLLRAEVAAYGREAVVEAALAELARYRQVRERYVGAAGGV